MKEEHLRTARMNAYRRAAFQAADEYQLGTVGGGKARVTADSTADSYELRHVI